MLGERYLWKIITIASFSFRVTLNIGAVGALRNVKRAISVARHVLEYTEHTLLVGELATQFAVSMGFTKENLTTEKSYSMWKEWKNNNCQPNFWRVSFLRKSVPLIICKSKNCAAL